MVDAYADGVVVRNDSIWQAGLQEFKFNAALYTGNTEKMENVIKRIQEVSEDWDMERFEIAFVNFDSWLKALKEKSNHRERFLALIMSNKQDKKLQKLHSSDLVS
jgi:hypothetical protein